MGSRSRRLARERQAAAPAAPRTVRRHCCVACLGAGDESGMLSIAPGVWIHDDPCASERRRAGIAVTARATLRERP